MEDYSKHDRTRHILLAEDEQYLAKSLNFILIAEGYKVSMAPDGRSALAFIHNVLLEHGVIDLLITDIAMPNMNGEELIKILKKQSLQIPILVMTGYGDKDMVIKLMRLGCQDFLDKPFDPKELNDRVKAILKKVDEDYREKKKEETLARLGEKSRSVIHDLNNILCGTLGYADIALEEIEKWHPAYKNMVKLLRTTTLAADVCKRLLSIKPGSPMDIKIKTEVRSLVEKITAILAAMAPENIKIKTIAPNHPVWLNADADRLQQALLNLGINAFHAMSNTGTLTFATTIEDILDHAGKPQKCVCITVSDTGDGIPKELINKLFIQEFTTKTCGNGIGLMTVKKIVDEHFGRIEVQNEPGKGAKFKLVFPLHQLFH